MKALGICGLLAALLVVAPKAQASSWPDHWHRHCHGPYKDWRLVSETVRASGPCAQNQALTLTRAPHSYPAMGGATLTVDFWQGSYAFPKHPHREYQVDVYSCDGVLQKSYPVAEDGADTIAEFVIDNPNLHDDVSVSFVANAPMTDWEAAAAMTNAKARCEHARNGL